jgi:hypothetical protein
MTVIERVQDAWTIASKKLGFDFTAPFQIEDQGKKVPYHGFVRNFGGKNGTLFFASERFDEDLSAASVLARKKGYYFSCINAAIYRSYDEEVFVEALTDWGWFGKPESCPAWFKKEPNQ